MNGIGATKKQDNGFDTEIDIICDFGFSKVIVIDSVLIKEFAMDLFSG